MTTPNPPAGDVDTRDVYGEDGLLRRQPGQAQDMNDIAERLAAERHLDTKALRVLGDLTLCRVADDVPMSDLFWTPPIPDQIAEVVAVGPDGPDVQPGDRIFHRLSAGKFVSFGGAKYVILWPIDVLAILDEPQPVDDPAFDFDYAF